MATVEAEADTAAGIEVEVEEEVVEEEVVAEETVVEEESEGTQLTSLEEEAAEIEAYAEAITTAISTGDDVGAVIAEPTAALLAIICFNSCRNKSSCFWRCSISVCAC